MYSLISLLGAAIVGGLLVYLILNVFGRQKQIGSSPQSVTDAQHVESIRTTPMTPDGIKNLQFTESFRGYNTDEVDEFLERLASYLDQRAPQDNTSYSQAN